MNGISTLYLNITCWKSRVFIIARDKHNPKHCTNSQEHEITHLCAVRRWEMQRWRKRPTLCSKRDRGKTLRRALVRGGSVSVPTNGWRPSITLRPIGERVSTFAGKLPPPPRHAGSLTTRRTRVKILRGLTTDNIGYRTDKCYGW